MRDKLNNKVEKIVTALNQLVKEYDIRYILSASNRRNLNINTALMLYGKVDILYAQLQRIIFSIFCNCTTQVDTRDLMIGGLKGVIEALEKMRNFSVEDLKLVFSNSYCNGMDLKVNEESGE